LISPKPGSFWRGFWSLLKNGFLGRAVFDSLLHIAIQSYILDCSIAPLFDKEGNISEYFLIAHDLTELIFSKKISKIVHM